MFSNLASSEYSIISNEDDLWATFNAAWTRDGYLVQNSGRKFDDQNWLFASSKQLNTLNDATWLIWLVKIFH